MKISNWLASLTLCILVYGIWLGGIDILISTGIYNTLGCISIFLVGCIYYVLGYKDPPKAWIGANNCISLGLLGTVTGFIWALSDFNDQEQVIQAIALALSTTGVGLYCSIMLYNHGYHMGLGSNEHLP